MTIIYTVKDWLARVCLSLFLLFMRVFWDWGLFEAGKGRRTDIQKPIGFFKRCGRRGSRASRTSTGSTTPDSNACG